MAKQSTSNLNAAHSAGLMSRFAYARAKQAGVDAAKLLTKSGLTPHDIHNMDVRIGAQRQIDFVERVADEISDCNFGFHLARGVDLRTIGLLYYVAGSAKTLGEAKSRPEGDIVASTINSWKSAPC
jgi:AraC-type transcriptional regulator